MTYEIYLQLLGRANDRQLKDTKFGLAHNLGGIPNRNVAAVSIFGMNE
jgi:acetyl-CoA C-acetyltransferase